MFLYVTHPVCLSHDNGSGHPEMGERLSRVQDALVSAQLMQWCHSEEARLASPDDISQVHSAQLLPRLQALSPQEGITSLGDDVSLNPYTVVAARYAAGAVLTAIDEIEHNHYKRAFCNVRPPGHHAEYDAPQGFCLFNNIAIGAAYARAHTSMQRIAIVDFDVHHGNGTEDFALRQPWVWFGSSYEDNIYPFASSDESDPSHICKMPLPSFSGSDAFRQAWQNKGLPALRAYQPDLILISAGFDGHALDPMANLRLHEADYAWISSQLVAIAKEFSQGRIISVLEGGYDLGALSLSVRDHVRTLFELD